ncbi:MAG: hypothetical protein IT352_07390 [Gemmatimonadales bacterium]|nr:hypothetical protein [Gemmatimonadales bacterium]
MTATLTQDPAFTRLQQFAALVRRHDPTYPFADDRRAFTEGAAQWQAMVDLAVALPIGEVMAILELRVVKFYARQEDVRSYLQQFRNAVTERRVGR